MARPSTCPRPCESSVFPEALCCGRSRCGRPTELWVSKTEGSRGEPRFVRAGRSRGAGDRLARVEETARAREKARSRVGVETSQYRRTGFPSVFPACSADASGGNQWEGWGWRRSLGLRCRAPPGNSGRGHGRKLKSFGDLVAVSDPGFSWFLGALRNWSETTEGPRGDSTGVLCLVH